MLVFELIGSLIFWKLFDSFISKFLAYLWSDLAYKRERIKCSQIGFQQERHVQVFQLACDPHEILGDNSEFCWWILFHPFPHPSQPWSLLLPEEIFKTFRHLQESGNRNHWQKFKNWANYWKTLLQGWSLNQQSNCLGRSWNRLNDNNTPLVVCAGKWCTFESPSFKQNCQANSDLISQIYHEFLSFDPFIILWGKTLRKTPNYVSKSNPAQFRPHSPRVSSLNCFVRPCCFVKLGSSSLVLWSLDQAPKSKLRLLIGDSSWNPSQFLKKRVEDITR